MPAVALIAATLITLTGLGPADTYASIELQGRLTPAHVADWWEAHNRYPRWIPEPPPLPAPLPVHSGMGDGNVERWRPLVEAHFAPGDVETALAIIRCESGGNPYAANPTSTARGLFQHLRGWWSGAWGSHGPFDPFDPAQSIAAGAYLRYENGGWGDWIASAHCWR